jgi:hypothetical protein
MRMAQELEIDAGVQGDGEERRVERKLYTTPVLRRLGTVRDLTLGSNNGSVMDGLKFMKVPPGQGM